MGKSSPCWLGAIGTDGNLRRIVDAGATGCRFDLGLVADRRCAVAGPLAGIFVFERGTHRYASDLSDSEVAIGEHAQA
jgi:hypothetical protein